MKLYTLFSKIQGAFYRQIEKIEDAFLNFRLRFSSYSKKTKASFLLMGLGQILYKQYIKGILYMLSEIAFILFFALKGRGTAVRGKAEHPGGGVESRGQHGAPGAGRDALYALWRKRAAHSFCERAHAAFRQKAVPAGDRPQARARRTAA